MPSTVSFDVPILMYHHLAADGADVGAYSLGRAAFCRQLDALVAWGYTPITVSEVIAAAKGRRVLPAHPVAITFDDGYQSFADVALPALLQRGICATVFVVVGEIGNWNRWDAGRGLPFQRLMGWADIRKALSLGMEVGAHGWVHRDLTASTRSELNEELVRSRGVLQDGLEAQVTCFSYPYGRYDIAHQEGLATAGYEGAVSIFSDEASVTANPYAMRRVYIHAGDGMLRFRAKVSQLYLRYLARRGAPKRRA